MRKISSCLRASFRFFLVGIGLLFLVVTTPVLAQIDLDVDDDGRTDALTDGLLVLRHMFGVTGEVLISNTLGVDAQRTDPEAIKTLLDDSAVVLDIDGDGRTDALTDGLLVLRSMFGLSGDALIAGVISEAGARQTGSEVVDYLQSIEDFSVSNIETEYLQIVNGVTIRTTEKIDASKYDFVEKYQMEERTQQTFKAPEGYKVAKAIAYVDKWPPEEKCSLDISVPISMYTLGLSEFTINALPELVGDPCPGPKTWYFTFGYVKNDVEIDVLEQINRQEPKLYE
ncbi:MAG: hypothetical protein OSA80_10370, partial [Porticoccaceae bacterium]|nr:hypothetical protein [Porticoccaceae bacterium]